MEEDLTLKEVEAEVRKFFEAVSAQIPREVTNSHGPRHHQTERESHPVSLSFDHIQQRHDSIATPNAFSELE